MVLFKGAGLTAAEAHPRDPFTADVGEDAIHIQDIYTMVGTEDDGDVIKMGRRSIPAGYKVIYAMVQSADIGASDADLGTIKADDTAVDADGLMDGIDLDTAPGVHLIGSGTSADGIAPQLFESWLALTLNTVGTVTAGNQVLVYAIAIPQAVFAG